MASETNELTFVRCPSCRSLVPASAARCRICNNPLEGGAKSGGAPDAAKTAGRVRQRTISADAGEVLEMTSEPPKRQAPAAPVAVSNGEDLGGEIDPLSAYHHRLPIERKAEA